MPSRVPKAGAQSRAGSVPHGAPQPGLWAWRVAAETVLCPSPHRAVGTWAWDSPPSLQFKPHQCHPPTPVPSAWFAPGCFLHSSPGMYIPSLPSSF